MLVVVAGLCTEVWTVTLGGAVTTTDLLRLGMCLGESEEELESPGLWRMPVVGERRGMPPLSCLDLLLSDI